ncbi:MAG: sigma-54 dependent transcriptional regulator [candidate division Zixibacteria bacterium]|nr:sigma-54 dependent transcriptional regulator [candidate division Zixibacteria bacterium]
MKLSVLVVDDDKLVNEFLIETLERAGYLCKSVFSGEEAVEEYSQKTYDIVLTDLKMKAMDGITLISKLKKIDPSAVIIMMTAYGTVETAVKAIKLGAYDFLLKPVMPATLGHIINRVSEMLQLRAENRMLKQDISNKFQNMIGKSKLMKNVFDMIQSIASARSTVMITGGSGTGKEMVARAIHFISDRREGPFIKLNCAAIPESLVEAELFGYEKGAFTDAKKMNRGRFELADGGTLLLDEISEMPINLQSKLLRVIQERELERIGSAQTISVDVRIVATSNRNLREFIANGKFREDLFFRLNVIPIQLPGLSERIEDVPLLTKHFIEKHNRENNRAIKDIEQSALKLLMSYHWPGNVRELENIIERAVVINKSDIITEDDFPIELTLGKLSENVPSLDVPMKLEDGNRYLILKTLEKFNGNKTRAAEALGITTRTIRNKLAEYEVSEN